MTEKDLQLIINAVEFYAGSWPASQKSNRTCLVLVEDTRPYRFLPPNWESFKGSFDFKILKQICTKSEFELAAQAMGYVGNSTYRWGVEYPAQSSPPIGVPGDVRIKAFFPIPNEWSTLTYRVKDYRWEKIGCGGDISMFIITDERYKPKNLMHVFNVFNIVENPLLGEQYLYAKKDFSSQVWCECQVVGFDNGDPVIKTQNGFYYCRPCSEYLYRKVPDKSELVYKHYEQLLLKANPKFPVEWLKPFLKYLIDLDALKEPS